MARKTLATGLAAGAIVCTLIVACTSSSTSPPTTDAGTTTNDNPTPPGTTPTTSAGMAGCTPLALGCFTDEGAYATPATKACASAGGPGVGAADTHCDGVTPQAVNTASCSILDAGPAPGEDAGSAEGGAASEDAGAPGPCGENSADYGTTMWGSQGKDDDCKYQVSYTASPICENNGTYFIVTASYLARSDAPLTGACTFAEICLSNTHPAPPADSTPPQGSQQVVEGPPGTYTIGPVVFDAPGDWTVRFHFNEVCCDIANDSPHGHAAFHVSVP